MSPEGIAPGSSAYRRVSLGLFLAGFATFSLLYCVQPILPLFAAAFRVSAAASSLALSLSTAALAVAILAAAALSESLGRRRLMLLSMTVAAALNIAAAAAPGWTLLLLIRALEGLALGGVPAVAMAYLAEEIAPSGLGLAMGLLVAGNACGGMIGRVLTGLLAELYSWRVAMLMLGGSGLLAALGFILLLPPSRRFQGQPHFTATFHLGAWRGHLNDPALLPLFAIAFLAMGAFAAIYNYAGFRLTAPPYSLSQSQMSAIFVVYLLGMAASALAGALADRLGRGVVLPAGLLLTASGVAVTLLPGLAAMVAGIALVTAGFFVSQAVASGWVGRLAIGAKGHATALYLLAYYLGASVVGSAAGWVWQQGGWNRLAQFILLLLALALLAAWRVTTRAR